MLYDDPPEYYDAPERYYLTADIEVGGRTQPHTAFHKQNKQANKSCDNPVVLVPHVVYIRSIM